jgi:hypothetical protein
LRATSKIVVKQSISSAPDCLFSTFSAARVIITFAFLITWKTMAYFQTIWLKEKAWKLYPNRITDTCSDIQ